MGPSDGWGAALLVGALAGLAVAVPVGPVGVLLLREGVVRGTRVAVGAALGVASVDAVYAVLAVVIGVPVGRAVEAHADVVRLTSAGVLLLVGAVGVVGAVGDCAPTQAVRPAPAAQPMPRHPTAAEAWSVLVPLRVAPTRGSSRSPRSTRRRPSRSPPSRWVPWRAWPVPRPRPSPPTDQRSGRVPRSCSG
ncbi:hypothetical protein [Cellulomonas soli]